MPGRQVQRLLAVSHVWLWLLWCRDVITGLRLAARPRPPPTHHEAEVGCAPPAVAALPLCRLDLLQHHLPALVPVFWRFSQAEACPPQQGGANERPRGPLQGCEQHTVPGQLATARLWYAGQSVRDLSQAVPPPGLPGDSVAPQRGGWAATQWESLQEGQGKHGH